MFVSAGVDTDREFEARLADSSALAFRVAYSVVRQRQDAEDVAQEAFARAYRKFSQLRDRERFRAWLVRMTWRLAIDFRRRSSPADAADERGADRPAPTDLEHEAIPAERAARLWRAIDALPEKLRLVVVLVSIEEQIVKTSRASWGARGHDQVAAVRRAAEDQGAVGMTDERHDVLEDLRAELGAVSPSPGFAASVRARVAATVATRTWCGGGARRAVIVGGNRVRVQVRRRSITPAVRCGSRPHRPSEMPEPRPVASACAPNRLAPVRSVHASAGPALDAISGRARDAASRSARSARADGSREAPPVARVPAPAAVSFERSAAPSCQPISRSLLEPVARVTAIAPGSPGGPPAGER